MGFILELPDQYSLVLAAATSTFFVNTMHVVRTSSLRKASGVKYPNAYASAEQADKDKNAYAFNCGIALPTAEYTDNFLNSNLPHITAQRAHANFTENHTSLLGALLIAGLQYPVMAAILGAGWSVSRVTYLFGYTSGAGPQGRRTGALGSALSDFALKLMAAYASAKFVFGI